MPDEIEVKILEINPRHVISCLESLGAQKILEARLKIREYDYPNGSLGKDKSILRIRSEGDKVVLCYKQRIIKSDFKVSDEHQVIVSDLEEACVIFEKLGFKRIGDKEKDRVSYLLRDIHYDIDKWPRIPAYMEVEAPSKALVQQGVELIGFSMAQTTSMTGTEVLKKYGIDVDKEKVFKF